MFSKYLPIYYEWVKKSTSVENCSVVNFLEELNYENILWLIVSYNDVFLLDYSDDIEVEFLNSITKKENFDIMYNWIKGAHTDSVIEFSDITREVIYLENDPFGNSSIILSDVTSFDTFTETEQWVGLAVNHYNHLTKIYSLESALRLGYSNQSPRSVEDVEKISLDVIKPAFIDSVLPFVFYSYVHEEFGPYIFDATGDEMLKPDYIITAVKLYSGLDAEMVADVGHVFKTDPTKIPVLGEIFTIVFTLPNSKARGEFEMHSISLVVPQEFYNLSKSLIGDFKAKLFAKVEQIRLLHEENSWGLAVEPFGESEHIKEHVHPFLEELQSEVSISFALLMDPDDVINW